MELDLNSIRGEIDDIDDKLLELFLRRMDLCVSVAKYKKEKGMPVFQGKREEDILKRMSAAAPDELSDGAKLLFTNLMDISKCLQRNVLSCPEPMLTEPFGVGRRVACPGTVGSNTEKACRKIFGDTTLTFYPDFEDIFRAVNDGREDYGVLPIENSSAGEVDLTYELLAEYDFYIVKSTQVSIDHCLAAKKTAGEIKNIYSHEQALMQCSQFLKRSGAKPHGYSNTALAAKMVAESDEEGLAAICSEDCAGLYGLEILQRRIADNPDNTTRFICVSKHNEVDYDSDIISLSLSVPHTSGALYRLLTRFYFYGLNLTRKQSAPVPHRARDIKTEAFDVIFYLDFEGSVKNPDVVRLLTDLSQEMRYFKYLGNYSHVE